MHVIIKFSQNWLIFLTNYNLYFELSHKKFLETFLNVYKENF